MSHNTTFNTEITPFEIETNLPPLRVLSNVFRSVCVPVGKFVLLGRPHVGCLFFCPTSGMAGDSRILREGVQYMKTDPDPRGETHSGVIGVDRCYIVNL